MLVFKYDADAEDNSMECASDCSSDDDHPSDHVDEDHYEMDNDDKLQAKHPVQYVHALPTQENEWVYQLVEQGPSQKVVQGMVLGTFDNIDLSDVLEICDDAELPNGNEGEHCQHFIRTVVADMAASGDVNMQSGWEATLDALYNAEIA